MTHERFLHLVKLWSNETAALSIHNRKHPAYKELLAEGEKIIPWLFERLQHSIGRDRGKTFDHDNSPWLSVCLLGELTKALKTFPAKHAGNLDKLREHYLEWGKKNGYKV